MVTPASLAEPGVAGTREVFQRRAGRWDHSSDLTAACMIPPGAAVQMRHTIFFCNDCFYLWFFHTLTDLFIHFLTPFQDL